MALGGVFMTDTDGNIGYSGRISNEQITGLVFDISKQTRFFESGAGLKAQKKLQNTVVEINSMEDLAELGITPYTGSTETDLLFGIPYYHIDHFFKAQKNANGRLFVAFADCTSNWDIIEKVQNASHGMISQIGVWTDQSLWYDNADEEPYVLKLVSDLNAEAEKLAVENAPLSIVLTANTALVDAAEDSVKTVDIARIPDCKVDARYVSICIGQADDPMVHKMHYANKANGTPVGAVGALLGSLAFGRVHESIAWVARYNRIDCFPAIEMGFGNIADAGSEYTSILKYSSLSRPQLDLLDDKGYIFLCKYSGIESGVYFSKDQTCSQGDFRTIARNRVINKSRRGVRAELLPYVNSPLRVDPSTGALSSAKVTMFQNIVGNVLLSMQNNEEISGYEVSIDPKQNVLKNDTLIIKYNIVPVGVSSRIEVVEGLALSNKR